MTPMQFINERTGEPISVFVGALPARYEVETATIFSQSLVTKEGDVVFLAANPSTRFFILEQDTRGLSWRPRPHYKVGLCRVTDTVSVIREDNEVASEVPAVCRPTGSVQVESPTNCRTLRKYKILTTATAIRVNDRLRLDGPPDRLLRVRAIDCSTWDSLLIVLAEDWQPPGGGLFRNLNRTTQPPRA